MPDQHSPIALSLPVPAAPRGAGLLGEPLQAVLDALGAHAAIVDDRGVIVAVNDGWRRFADSNGLGDPLYGIGASYIDIAERAQRDGLPEDMAAAMRELLAGERSTYEAEYACHAPHEKRWFILRAHRFESGGRTWALVTHENITPLRQAVISLRQSEAAARKLALVASQTDSIVKIMDARGRIEWANESFARITGHCFDGVRGRTLWDVLGAEGADPSVVSSLRERLGCGQGLFTQVLRVRPDGGEYWLEVQVQPIYDESGRLANFVSIERDITERKVGERQAAERARHQEVIAILGRSALAQGDVGALMDQTVALVAGTLSAQFCEVLELLPDGRSLLLRAGSGFAPGVVGCRRIFPSPGSLPAQALAAAAPVASGVFDGEHPGRLHALVGERGMCGASVPIAREHAGGRPFGVLSVYAPGPRRFGADEVNFLEAVANLLAVAITRADAESALREREEQLRFAHRSANAAAWSWDIGAGLVAWSDGYSISGLERSRAPSYEEWLGSIHPDDRDAADRAAREAVERRTDLNVEFRVPLPAEGWRWVSIVGRTTYDAAGAPLRMAGIAMDITERKAAQEARARQLAVERELESVREAVAAMDQVLGVVGHELRTPLASLRLLSEFLLMDDSIRQPWHETMAKIHGVAIGMAESVDGLLEAARINSGRACWKWGKVDLVAVCDSAAEVVRPLLHDSPVLLDVRADEACREMTGDSGAIRRLLVNLVVNACKHTQRGSVSVRIAPERDGGSHAWVAFTVADTGCGMTPEMLGRLGVPFALNAGGIGPRHASGSGLGVSICAKIAAAHGGTLRVASAPGEGTRIIARLRADLPGPAAPCAGHVSPLEIVPFDADGTTGAAA